MAPPPDATNRELLLPYAAPYLAFVASAWLAEGRLDATADYALRTLATGAALAWAWRSYVPLARGRARAGSLALGVGAGLAGTALWIALLAPFRTPAEATAWSPDAVAARAFAAVALVPLAEELFMRGYVLRLVLQWQHARRDGSREPLATVLDHRSLAHVSPGAWTPLAVAAATAAFALGHRVEEWPAAAAYGLLMAALWIARGDLLTCVVAHATTNAALAAAVFATGRWELW